MLKKIKTSSSFLNFILKNLVLSIFLSFIIIFCALLWTSKPIKDTLSIEIELPIKDQYLKNKNTRSEIKLINYISNKYKINKDFIKDIVLVVYDQTEYVDFPKAPLVLAIIAVESSFNSQAISHKGAIGLMQLMPVHDPEVDIQANILRGIWVLKTYRERVSSDIEALHAYNVGITAFKKGQRNYAYVKKVVSKEQEFLRF